MKNFIEKARARLAKNENIDLKKGDETLNWIIKVGVGLVLLGIVAAILFFFLRDTGDDINEQAASISGTAAGYSADCDVNRAIPAGVISRVLASTSATTRSIQIPFVENSNYRIPTAAFVGDTAADPAVAGTPPPRDTIGVLGVNGDTRIGFVVTSEQRYNADFNGNGVIDAGTVVGILQDGAAVDISPTANFGSGTNATHLPTGDGAVPILLADTQTDIAAGQSDITQLDVGQRLMVNRLDSCWRVA